MERRWGRLCGEVLGCTFFFLSVFPSESFFPFAFFLCPLPFVDLFLPWLPFALVSFDRQVLNSADAHEATVLRLSTPSPGSHLDTSVVNYRESAYRQVQVPGHEPSTMHHLPSFDDVHDCQLSPGRRCRLYPTDTAPSKFLPTILSPSVNGRLIACMYV